MIVSRYQGSVAIFENFWVAPTFLDKASDFTNCVVSGYSLIRINLKDCVTTYEIENHAEKIARGA